MSQYKSLGPVEVKSEERGEVTAIFARFNVIDHDGDVTLPGAFTDGAPVRISAYGHSSWEGALPVGKGRIRTTSTEAILEGKFFLQTPGGRDTFTVVKELAELGEWSFGFDIVEHSFGEFNDRNVRFLKKLKVHEISPVLVGAGIDTMTLAVKRRSDRLTDEERAILAKGRLIAAEYELEQARINAQLQVEFMRFAASMANGGMA